MKKAGRPTKYKPEMCQAVIDVGASGGTLAQMASEIGITRETLRQWCKENETFSCAVKEGTDLAQAWWEKKGQEATFGGVDGFNATAWIFNMKNRFKDDWRDKQERELTGGFKVVSASPEDEDI